MSKQISKIQIKNLYDLFDHVPAGCNQVQAVRENGVWTVCYIAGPETPIAPQGGSKPCA